MNPVKKTRILLVGLPTMLLDIVSEVLESQPDFIVVASKASLCELPSAAKEAVADIVIVQQTSEAGAICDSPLLSMQPPLKVLTLSEDGRRCFLDEFRLCRDALGEISAQRLVDVIRSSSVDGSSTN